MTKNTGSYVPPWWVIIVSFLTDVLIAIFVPIAIIAVVQHRSIADVFMQLLARLSELL